MKKIFALALLVAVPALAGQPTPRPRTDSINLNSSRSNIYRTRATPTPTPRPVEVPATTVKGSRSNGSERSRWTEAGTDDARGEPVAPTPNVERPGKPTKEQRLHPDKMLGTAKEVAPTPTLAPAEATTVKGSKSNGSERLGTGEAPVTPTPGPAEGKPQKQQLENQRGALTFGRDAVREVAPGTPTPATQRKRIAYSEDARRSGAPKAEPSPTPARRPR